VTGVAALIVDKGHASSIRDKALAGNGDLGSEVTGVRRSMFKEARRSLMTKRVDD
jgi:hypothetical protein